MAKRQKKPKSVERELRVIDAISEACGELTTLGEEMREWYDNMPEGPQSGDKGSQVEEAASTLEDIQEPDVPSNLGKIKFKWTEVLGRGNSRAKRRDDAVQTLDALITFLGNLEDECDKRERSDPLKDMTDAQLEELKAESEELRESLEEIKDNAEGVDFPGMYG